MPRSPLLASLRASGMRRSKHCCESTESSISTMFSQEACVGVRWNSSDLLHDPKLHESVGQQLHAPALLALGRIATGQSHHIRFLLARELALPTRTRRLVESPLQSSLYEALARPLDRAHAREQCFSYLFVGTPLVR